MNPTESLPTTAAIPFDLLIPEQKSARRVAVGLLLAFGFLGTAALLAPWQQTVPGTGQVVAFSPADRQQRIDATINGRVARFLVEEGTEVKAGTPIVELEDNDPELLSRMSTERSAVELRLENQEQRVLNFFERVSSLERSQRAQLESAEAEIHIAIEELASAEQKLLEAKAELDANAVNKTRHDELLAKGLASQRDLEIVRLAEQKSQAAVTSAEANVRAGQGKLRARKAALERVRATTKVDIESAIASLRDAESEVGEAKATLAKVDVEISRQEARSVLAPVDGTILRVMGRLGGQQVARGEALAILVPKTADRAVALEVDGNDASLIQTGAKVRLQFEGWPAVQFSGWPAVAVGTFGGVVSFVDAADDGEGNFRVVIRPDPAEPGWPEANYLRQGVRAKGWFLLKQVSLGYELWRRFNGFPPALKEAPNESDPGKRDFDKAEKNSAKTPKKEKKK